MKLLVSDYDGTLKSDDKNLRINIEAIKRFRQQGNVFAISTGRPYNSIIKECIKYNIPADYLMCNDGAVIAKRSEIIHVEYLTPEAIKKVVAYSCARLTPYNEITATSFYDQIVELEATYHSRQDAKNDLSILKEEIPEINYIRFGRNAYIKSNNTSKAKGIKKLIELEHLENIEVYTIGDNINDLSMLQAYNGYKMLISAPQMLFHRFPITREVHTLIRKISD